MPNLKPIVEGIDTAILLNNSIAVSDLFTVTDPDGDAITQYRISDSSSASSTGFFIFQGVIQANGSELLIDAEDLDELFYVGGPVVGNEFISIQARDSEFFSDPGLALVYSAREESVPPIAMVDSVSVLGNEFILASTFISAFDPDGYPIQTYTIRDRNIDNSFFSLDGIAVPQGTFRTYSKAEFSRLQYNAVGRRDENVDVFAFDGTVNSAIASGVVNTLANVNRPVVDFAMADSLEDELTPIAPLVSFSDADGNTIKTVELRDRNDKSFSGSLVFRGQDLAPKQFHSFTLAELDEVFFRGGERNISEQVRFFVTDGRFRSDRNTIVFDNVASGGGPQAGIPQLEADNLVESVQEQLEMVAITDLITQTDSGFPGLTFEVIDTNTEPVSASLFLNGQQLASGEVLTFTDNQFEQLQVRTGTFEGRHFDEIYVRTNNGTFNSDWTRINMMTEPEYFDAFTLLTPLGNTVATWDDFIQDSNPLPITFSFMQQFPDYETGEAEEDPGRQPVPRLFIPFTVEQRAGMRQILDHIETIADIDFIEVADSPLVVDPVSGNRGGTLRFANYYRALDEDLGGAEGADDGVFCTQPFGPSTAPQGGDVWVNVDLGSTGPMFTNDDGVPAISPCVGLDFLFQPVGPGTFEYQVMLNAVASAIGQGAPFDVVGGGDQNPILPGGTSNDMFTVQALPPLPPINPVTGYSLYDVNYFQRIYGPNMSHNAGDTLYSIGSNLIFGADSREVIWDGGGTDTLSAMGSTVDNVVVDLRPGFFSSIGNVENNIAIAFRAEIENAVGSVGDDQLIGNELNNRLIGGDGNDTLRGNGGDDFLIGGTNGDTYVFTVGDGDDRINEMQLAGRDRVEFLEFPGLDDFTEDFTFRLDGRDLVIQLTLDGSSTADTTVTIEDQTRGAYRIESLVFGTTIIDLENLTNQADGTNQQFTILPESTIFGNLVAPI